MKQHYTFKKMPQTKYGQQYSNLSGKYFPFYTQSYMLAQKRCLKYGNSLLKFLIILDQSYSLILEFTKHFTTVSISLQSSAQLASIECRAFKWFWNMIYVGFEFQLSFQQICSKKKIKANPELGSQLVNIAFLLVDFFIYLRF